MAHPSIRAGFLACLLGLIVGPVQASNAPTLEEVQRTLRATGAHWIAGPTSVSAQDWDSFRATLGLRVPPEYARLPKVDLSKDSGREKSLPDHWDWREHEGTTPVQNQGSCGSCWAFAAVGELEAVARLDDGVIYDLSEQELLSCNTRGYGCGGGWFDGCYEVFNTLGAVSEECMPYQASDGVRCSAGACEPLARASDLIWIENSVPSIKAAVQRYGPIACGMEVASDFRYYTGGCYEHPGGHDLNHAVVIVGWDDNMCDGQGAWIVKNSWSMNWGTGGYFNIHYGDCLIGDGAVVFVHAPIRFVSLGPAILETTNQRDACFEIDTEIRSQARVPLNPDSACLFYRVNRGDWLRVGLAPTGVPDHWTGRIPAQERPSTIDYYLRAVDMEGHAGTTPLGAPDTTLTFDLAREWEAFEGSAPDWSVGEADDDATTGIWECVDPVGTEAQPENDHTWSGTRCWVTGQHTPGERVGSSDVDDGKTTLLSPVWDLTGSQTAVVKYWRWYSNGKGLAPGEDPWVVQVRNNGGSWVDLENITQSNETWVQVTADLIPLLGPSLGSVQFRFVASDRGIPSCIEAAVDDFALMAEDRNPSSTEAASPLPVLLQPAWPNPLVAETAFHFVLAREGPADLEIFGPGGRRVRSLAGGALERGEHAILWDGRDDAGSPVASGVYFGRLRAAGEQQTQPVIVLR